jgi:predicted GIY-YIG superfamily endonuclease
MDKPWFVYCLATVENPPRTYIGATIDLDRRLSQHNGEQSGGAKATSTRPAGWYRVCHVEGFETQKQALQFEWRWKFLSRKLEGTPLLRRQNGLDKTIEWSKQNNFPDLKISYG